MADKTERQTTQTAEELFAEICELYGTPEEFREKYLSEMTDMLGYRPGEELESMGGDYA